MKYVFVTGGVISSVGKGVTAASLGQILKSKGYAVTNIKCDMYVNVDAGTINPFEHGEVFVGNDGIEADQDLGNYERFTGQQSTRNHYITTGQVYQEVIRKERNLEYDGEDVEVYPDVPNEIIRRIQVAGEADGSDVTIVEFGGTIGEYQLLLFLEAARMMKYRSPKDVSVVLVSYLPVPSTVGEMKTKPTQYAIRSLNSAGLQANFVVCRSKDVIPDGKKQKIADVCSINPDHIIAAPDCDTIYRVPLLFEEQGFGDLLLDSLELAKHPSQLTTRKSAVDALNTHTDTVTIAIIGKYVSKDSYVNTDTYISVLEAIKHASWHCHKQPNIVWINSEDYETDPDKVKELHSVDAVVIPGGFGTRGIEGKLTALRFIRENDIPYLGLCYGMQLMAIEYARNVLGISDAASEERGTPSKNMIIHTMAEQRDLIKEQNYGASMRLGACDCTLQEGSQSIALYRRERSDHLRLEDTSPVVAERHRHRYEFNNAYQEAFASGSIRLAGVNTEQGLVEIIEHTRCAYMIGVQFHPEYLSRLDRAHPLFIGLLEAAISLK